jgi:apolipoprotein N-acyltransferase
MVFLFFFGLLFSLASMPNPLIHLPLGIFIGFIPLFALNQKLSGTRRFIVSLLFLELFAVVLLVPLDAVNLVYVFPDTLWIILIFLIIGFIYALSFTFASFLSDKYGWNMSPIYFGISWVVAQYLLTIVPFAFPFPIETVLATFPIMIQSARVLGPYFIAFLIIFTNTLLANALFKKDRRIWAISIMILLALHVLNMGYGSWSLDRPSQIGEPVRIAIIQTNLSLKDFALKEQSGLFNKLLNRKLIDISKESLKKSPELIIWPELSGDYILQSDDYLNYLHKNITSKGAELLIGTTYIDYCDQRKKYNIAFILKTDGDMTDPYRKNRTFPLFETQWASRGEKYVTLASSTPFKNVGCMICLESICPQVARGLVRSGAKVLICISVDTSFGNSMVPYIHSASMVFRAIENNIYGIHVGNTGPSLICDNKGRVITQIPYGKTGYANAVIYTTKN